MRQRTARCAILVALFLCGCATRSTGIAPQVAFDEIAPGVWTHTAYLEIEPWGPVASSGLVVVADAHIVLVDTAWTDEQTREILDWADTTFGRPVTGAVFTHGHNDKMGGVAAVRERNIPNYANHLSNRLARRWGLTPAARVVEFDGDGEADAVAELAPLTLFYPGPGHTDDNIVVGVNGTEVLFVGCLVRPGSSGTLGNTNDADVGHWADAVVAVTRRFPEASLVVPSHGAPGSRALLDHTIELARR
ncbi:MAG: subclass B1 metallo-beta-lactamase, partial [Pseudomonadota bacterium]